MNIEIRLNNPERRYRPGEMIEGEVRLRSDERQSIESVEVEVVSEHADIKEMSGRLAGEGVIDGETVYPLMIRMPHGSSADDGGWQVTVKVRGEGDGWSASIPITVEMSAAGKANEVFGLLFGILLLALPFLAGGAYGMGFAISSASGTRIPLGVIWFAFIGGFCGVLIARAIMGGRERGRVTPWMAAPITLLLAALGLLGLYIAMIQPEMRPIEPIFRPGSIGSLLSIVDNPDTRVRVLALLAAGLLLPTAAGVMLRRPVAPWLQVEIAMSVITGTIALVVLGSISAGLATTGAVPTMNYMPEIWLIALIGIISIPGAFTRPTWTAAPTVAVAAGIVPLIAGVLALYASFTPGRNAQMFERIVAMACVLWGVAIIYRGGRNVIVAISTAHVNVAIAPESVSVGGSFSVRVAVDPRREVRLESISGVLRCTQIYAIRSGTADRRTEHRTVHTDRRAVQLDEQLVGGKSVERELRFTIPVGLNPSDNSSSSGTFWSLDVKVAFAGSADWAGTYPITVVSSSG